MSLQYWYMLPLAIVIATIATASSVGGVTFFAPLFILALRIPPELAIGTALITEVFGFASGLYAYARKRLIDYRLGTALLVTTIPLALLGMWISERIEPDILIKTDQGNLILGCHFGPLSQPDQLATRINERAGIVEHGLFLGLATITSVASS